MILGVPVSELLLLAGLIIVAGFVTGILAGLFGIGGGALIVPVLYEVFGVLGVPDEVRFQLCVGTSIAIIVPTNVLSFRIHRDKGAVMMDVVRQWAVPAVLGVAASLMGISGGSIANMILTLHGKPIHSAVATSAALGVPITVAGTIGYLLAGLPQQALMPPFSIGFVSLIGFALMAPVASFTAPYGARLAHALSRRQLEIGFGCFLLAVSA